VTPLRFRHRLHRFACFALFTMLGLALAPSVSKVVSAQAAGNPFTQVCSAASGGAASDDEGGSAAMHLEHCALCCVAAAPMLPPAAPSGPAAPVGASYIAARFLDASHTLFAWTSAQARAPPRLS
jgi:Protein of unknown function (DUF2946)